MKRFRLIILSLLTFFITFGIFKIQSFAESKYTKVHADTKKLSLNRGMYRLEYRAGKTLDTASLKIWDEETLVKTIKNVSYYIVLNDENVHFVQKNTIMKFSLDSLETIKVVTFSTEPYICDIKENTVFYTVYPKNAVADSVSSLYSYDMDLKKTSFLAKNVGNCYLGKDRLAYTPATFDVSPTALFSIDYNGKGLKKLADYVMGTKVIDNKLYYCGYKSYYPLKGEIYCCNFDGSDKKKLSKKKIEAQGIVDITKKYVIFMDDNFQKKKMDFKSGKIVKVK